MVQTELLEGILEGAGFVARAIIGHGVGDGKTKAIVISGCRLGKSDGTYCLLVGEDVGKADAGGILDTDINIFATDTPAIGSTLALPAEAVACPV